LYQGAVRHELMGGMPSPRSGVGMIFAQFMLTRLRRESMPPIK
jgi:hypothetical protein